MTTESEMIYKDDLSVSERLHKARLDKGLSLEEIAEESCVSQRYLQAIEAGSFEKLPELTFSVGFVRAFARVVGEDEEMIACRFKEDVRSNMGHPCGIAAASTPEGMKAFTASHAADKSKRKLPNWMAPFSGLLGVGATAFVLGTSVWSGSATNADALPEGLTEAVAEKAHHIAQGTARSPQTPEDQSGSASMALTLGWQEKPENAAFLASQVSGDVLETGRPLEPITAEKLTASSVLDADDAAQLGKVLKASADFASEIAQAKSDARSQDLVAAHASDN